MVDELLKDIALVLAVCPGLELLQDRLYVLEDGSAVFGELALALSAVRAEDAAFARECIDGAVDLRLSRELAGL